MIVEVVPIIRLRRLTTWWSYRVPAQLQGSIQAGSLVSIPFRGRATLGVVWEVRRETPESTLEPVSTVHTSQPLLLKPHRELVSWLAGTGYLSLSTALYTWLPAALRTSLTKNTREALKLLEHAPRTAPGLASINQQAAISPFQQPAAAQAMQQRFGEGFWNTFAETTPNQELEKWLAVRTGKVQVVFGRERAMFAPYLNVRQVVLGEAEDPSYYHSQLPYLPLQQAAFQLAASANSPCTVRSSLPPATGRLLWGRDVASTLKEREVTLTDLRREPILNPQLVQAIAATLKQNRQVLLLINSYDHTFKADDGLATLIPGAQTLAKQLAQALGVASLPETVHLGTRSILAETHRDVGFTAALALDSQLHPQSFADELSLWSDLGSLLSYPCPCTIQAKQQDHPVLHALRNRSFAQYTLGVLEERKAAGLPPARGTIFCSLPQSDSAHDQLTALANELKPLLTPDGWQVSDVLERTFRKKVLAHIALIPPQGVERLPTAAAKMLAKLIRPWKVQVSAWHIL